MFFALTLFSFKKAKKSFAKPIFQSHGLKVAPGMVIHERDWQIDEVRILARCGGYQPAGGKVAHGGKRRA